MTWICRRHTLCFYSDLLRNIRGSYNTQQLIYDRNPNSAPSVATAKSVRRKGTKTKKIPYSNDPLSYNHCCFSLIIKQKYFIGVFPRSVAVMSPYRHLLLLLCLGVSKVEAGTSNHMYKKGEHVELWVNKVSVFASKVLLSFRL
jgi:hypothetical protein